MWILSSMGRPDRIRDVVDTYDWAGADVMLTLYDGDPRLPEYQAQKWPSSWNVATVPMRGNGPTYNEILRRYPDERFYGFLADDAILDVRGMLSTLEYAAGYYNVAYANDQHWGPDNCTMPCIGGNLVRAVGYLAPEYFVHMAIDNVWHEIGRRLDVLRYFPALTYTHKHPLFGRAPSDATYHNAAVKSFGYQEIFRAWQHGGACGQAVSRAQAASQRAA